VYSATTVNAAVNSAMDQVIPSDSGQKYKFSAWFSGSLKYYIMKKNYFIDVLRKANYYYYYYYYLL
jgi:hypothetical protein